VGVQGSRASLAGVLASGVGFSYQDDQRALTPEPDVGDLLSVSFSLEPGVSQVQSSATDKELLLDVAGFEAVAQGFLADASEPSPLVLDQDILGVDVQVSEEAIKNGSEMVESLSAQEAVQLVAWRKTFRQMPYKNFLQGAQAELKTGVTHMEATFIGCTLPCSEAFHASSTAYDREVEDVKDTYYKPYILAVGNYAGCLFNTLPPLPPLPPHMFPPHLIPSPPSLLPTSLPSLHAPSPPALCPHPPSSVPVLPSTSLPLPPPSRPCTSRPSHSYHSPAFPPHCASPHFSSPSYHPATILSLFTCLHSLLLRIRVSGGCLILLDIGLQCVSVCMFLFSLPRPLGS